MTEAEAARLEGKLDTLIKLLALDVALGEGTLKEKAVRLQRAGLSPKEIAELCDTTPNTVSVALSKAKAEKKARGKEAGNG